MTTMIQALIVDDSPTLRQLTRAILDTDPALQTPTPTWVEPSHGLAAGRVQLIAMGSSTGGPPALQLILSKLPADLPVPIVAVQHISHGFVGGLARWMDGSTRLRVKVADNGERLQPGTVYLAADDHHLLVTHNGLARLSDAPLVGGHQPSATALFESVAQSYGPAAVGVLLTGMGSDGTGGLKALREVGGRTIAQDRASCVVFGMPEKAIALGGVDEIVPLKEIAARLVEMVAVLETHG